MIPYQILSIDDDLPRADMVQGAVTGVGRYPTYFAAPDQSAINEQRKKDKQQIIDLQNKIKELQAKSGDGSQSDRIALLQNLLVSSISSYVEKKDNVIE